MVTRDRAFYRRIGALGNRAGAAAKGHAAQRASLGEAGYADHQRRAGEALLAQRGKAWFAELGRRRHGR